jgi:hypothetical protein
MPSESEIDADPNLGPIETIITTTMTDNPPTSALPKITSTETGYVVIGNYQDTRIHIVNILGDSNSSYEPYEYVLKYPNTNDEIETAFAFAVKYTSKIVFLDPITTTDEFYGFTIIDLATDTIVDQFQIEKSYWYSPRWITGVNDVLFLTGQQTSDFTATWRSYIYDLRKPSGSRLINPSYSSNLSKGLMPGGSQAQSGADSATLSLTSFMSPHIYGDETCLLTEYVENNFRSGVGELHYIDLDNYNEPINMLSGVGMNSSRYLRGNSGEFWNKRIQMGVYKFNNGKQRIIVINSAHWYYYSTSEFDTIGYFTFALDANVLRDTKTSPVKMNCINTAIPNISTDWCSNSQSYACHSGLRSSCMFRGKVLLSEHNGFYYNYRSIAWQVNGIKKTQGDRHRWVDPNTLIPHRIEGTTTTIQTWNNPKRIYGFNGIVWKLINSTSIWTAEDDPNNT